MMITRIMLSIAGFVLLLFTIPELVAQIAKVTIKLGPVAYGPIPKVQIGNFAIYFKGVYRYIFILILFAIAVLGLWLMIFSVIY